ncbi:MAG: PAS domain S-box protein [Alphaproteobacteria bacterium]|nr:PAS domain S-box protein [Alphaproteobacteria bacterium]
MGGNKLSNTLDPMARMLRQSINCLHQTYILWDSNDRLVLCNDRFREVNRAVADLLVPGTSYEEFLRAGVAKGCYPDAEGQEADWLEERLQRHRNPCGLFEMQREDGLWILIDEQRMPDGGIVSIATDITAQKLAEAALRETETRFRQHAAASSDWLWEIDAEKRYTYVSDVLEEKVGRRAEDYLGTTVDANIDELYIREDWQPFLDAFEARRPIRDLVVKRHDPDGREQWIRTSGTPFYGSGGEFLGYRGKASDVTEYVEAERKLRDNDKKYLEMFNRAQVGLARTRISDSKLLEANDHLAKIYGYADREEILAEVRPSDRWVDPAARERMQAEGLRRGGIRDLEVQHTRKDGTEIWIRLSTSYFPELDYLETTNVDITEQKSAEECLIQSQKMEAVGQLTGGVAHEFNNLLQVIAGNIELLTDDIPSHGGSAASFQAIQRNIRRGAELTSRLLSFSRQQPLTPKALSVREILSGLGDLLGRTLGETIEVRLGEIQDAWQVRADLSQLENALLNLALNARDAMPGGGAIEFSAENLHLDAEMADRHGAATPGDYIVFAVADNGTGMTEDEAAHAFEPFFTTKDVGKGTGLGLSMVYGFAQQSGGFAEIESEPGRGTTMRIYLPRASAASDTETAPENLPGEHASGNDRTILLVEDDMDVRTALAEQLTDLGYRVIEAENGVKALAMLENGVAVDLLFTDVVMPGGLSGLDLARRARTRWPELKVLYATGYSEEVVADAGQPEDGCQLLRKPFSRAILAAAIADTLDDES